MVQVVVSDLDGTLLGSDSKVDPFTASTLQEIQARGIKLVIATSRHPLETSLFSALLGIHAYLITATGARVHDPHGSCILARDFEPAVARSLMSAELVSRRLLGVFADDGWLLNRPSPELAAYSRGSGFAAQVRDLGSHDGRGLFMVMYMGDRAGLVALEAEILGRFPGKVRTVFVTEHCLEITPPEASKSNALEEVLRGLGIPASACVGFGDGDNDIDILSLVGRPFVMGKSSPGLLAALPDAPSAGSNDDAGVARTLRALLGLPGLPH